MLHHARTLTAVAVVLAATLAAGAGPAQGAIVRVETRDMNSIRSGAYLPRTEVAAQAVEIEDALGAQPAATCPADSPVAAVIAAFGGKDAGQVKTIFDPGTGHWLISRIRSLGPAYPTPLAAPPWYWRVYYDQAATDKGGGWNGGDVCASPQYPSSGAEVLVYQACGTITGNTTQCYSGTPLYLRIRDGGPYDIAAQTVPGRGAPVAAKVFGDPPIGTPAAALFGTDEASFVPVKSPATGPLAGQAAFSFTELGPHQVIAVAESGARPPARLAVCVSEGNDGFCGSTKAQPPPEIPYDPSPCATNGRDGFCGTVDATGPITHVTNIPHKKAFKAKKGPGQVKGTIETDPNGVGRVQLRLTRVTTARVLVKSKKKAKGKKAGKRYKTVKRCTAWSDAKALLVTTKCGPKNAKWFTADLNDLRNEFTYSFALTLPRGSYTLEVLADDEDGHKDPPTPGRNVITFTVK